MRPGIITSHTIVSAIPQPDLRIALDVTFTDYLGNGHSRGYTADVGFAGPFGEPIPAEVTARLNDFALARYLDVGADLAGAELGDIEAVARGGEVPDTAAARYATTDEADVRVLDVALSVEPPAEYVALLRLCDHVSKFPAGKLTMGTGVSAGNLLAVRNRLTTLAGMQAIIGSMPRPITG